MYMVFAVAQLILAKLWNQPRYLSTQEWIQSVDHMHKEILFSHTKDWNYVISSKMSTIGHHSLR